MCSLTSLHGVASRLVENSGNPGNNSIGCCHRCYFSLLYQVRYDYSMVVDCFVVCTYGSWSEQFGCCCEKNVVVANALLCYPHSHVSSVLKHRLFLSIDLNFANLNLFSVPL